MAKKHKRLVLLFALLLVGVAILAGIGITGRPDQATSRKRSGARAQARLIDQQPLQTAEQLEKLATTREELWRAREAIRTADHAVDLAFSAALREIKAHPPAQDPKTKPLLDRVHELEAQVKENEARVSKLTELFSAAKGAKADDIIHQLQLAEAELVLRQDEIADAKLALRRAGGDPESRIQQLFTQHKAAYHSDQGQPAAPPPKFEAFHVPGTMVAQLQLWQQLRTVWQQVEQAKQQAAGAVAVLEPKRSELAAEIQRLTNSSLGGNATPDSTGAFDRIAEDRVSQAEFDARIQDQQHLVEIYGDWSSLLTDRIRACTHGLLKSVFWIFLIVVFVIGASMIVTKASLRMGVDRRRRATMRLLGRFVVQLLGLLLILLVLLGSPRQLSTIVAFAGAGLTIALKDFIVAFFGWFVLMGKNGIRVGDWVEINGISGEVIEIGLLRTVLLETGNWADTGHPTGRKVTFVNNYAIEGHYFNFSTTGQWLWDSLEILVPAGQDPYPITDAILKLVVKETEENAREAEQEWHRATQQYGVQHFSAVPAIDLRPSYQGITMVVRYITRANQRHEVRRRLYELVVHLLHGRELTAEIAPADNAPVITTKQQS